MATAHTKAETRPSRTVRRPTTDGHARTRGSPSIETLRRDLLATVAGHYPQADLAPVDRAFDHIRGNRVADRVFYGATALGEP